MEIVNVVDEIFIEVSNTLDLIPFTPTQRLILIMCLQLAKVVKILINKDKEKKETLLKENSKN